MMSSLTLDQWLLTQITEGLAVW